MSVAFSAATAAVRAEVAKLAALPSVWIGSAVAVVLPLVLTAINLPGRLAHPHSPRLADAGLQELTVGVIGVIVLAASAVASEYGVDRADDLTGRGVTATLLAVPRRTVVLISKVSVVVVWCAVLASVAAAATLVMNRMALGPSWVAWGPDLMGRATMAATYQVAMALLSFALTTILRNGVLPVIVLAINSSVASFSYLVSRLTAAGFYFPDMAGMRTFLTVEKLGYPYGPGAGAAVLTGWVVVGLVAATAVFLRRDA